MTPTRRILTHIAILLFLSLSASRATAATTYPNPLNPGGDGPIDTIPGFLALVLNGLTTLLIPLVVIFVIYAGYLFVTAQGEAGKIEKARAALLWTIIGTAVIIGAEIMADILQDTLTELNQP